MSDDFEKQRQEWEAFARASEARGLCPHSGETFAVCKESICDCFDYPSEAAVPYRRDVLTTVLVYHWRESIKGCSCGWSELGRSWAEHVANVYEQSAVAVGRPPR